MPHSQKRRIEKEGVLNSKEDSILQLLGWVAFWMLLGGYFFSLTTDKAFTLFYIKRYVREVHLVSQTVIQDLLIYIDVNQFRIRLRCVLVAMLISIFLICCLYIWRICLLLA